VPPEAHLPITIEHLELHVMDDSDGLVVAADVLANSLVYLFRTRSGSRALSRCYYISTARV